MVEMTDRYNQPTADDMLKRRELAAGNCRLLGDGDRTGLTAQSAKAENRLAINAADAAEAANAIA
jgi:hypothetical protein